MRPSHFIFIRGKHKTGKLVARELGAHYHRRKARCYIPINYGGVHPQAILNKRLYNKLTQLKVLKRAELPTIPFFEHKQEVSQFPVLGRKKFHYQGRDIKVIQNEEELYRDYSSDFYTLYIPKRYEYRVHVVLGSVLINIKIRKDESINPEELIVWNHKTGFKFITYEGRFVEDLTELGLKTLQALNYDFGAIDIIRSYDKRFYILEVNSAPGLSPKRLEWYKDQFLRWMEGYNEV